jgi:hypothetical protein
MLDNPYLKFFVQLAATVLAALYPLIVDGNFSVEEQLNVLIVGLGAVGVLGAGNLPEGVWRYTKLIVSVASAMAVLAASLITDGFNGAEIVQIVIAGLAALGVRQAPGPIVQPTGRHRAA